MKLTHIEHRQGYRLVLTFADGEVRETDLLDLLGAHVALDALDTAHIDPEWGCLEFLGGRVDIDPTTLYRYACGCESKQAA